MVNVVVNEMARSSSRSSAIYCAPNRKINFATTP